jgi:glutamate synthase domain-containing protein 3
MIRGLSQTRSKPTEIFNQLVRNIKEWDSSDLCSFAQSIATYGRRGDEERAVAISILNLLIDRRFDTGDKRRSDMLHTLEKELYNVFSSIPSIESGADALYCHIDWDTRSGLRKPTKSNQTLTMDVSDFAPEGQDGTCQFLDRACTLGWKKIIAYNFTGQRNFGAGLVTKDEVKIDVYGRVGDCLAAFADGPEIHVHESAQDSVGYCLKSGKLVISGDAGKAFEYGAKGGVAFIQGDVVDRPLINAVGGATAVINGSCKDYMGESFMAANGLIILNGIGFENGRILEQETPYHGGNLFPLAAAGAVYLRDPRKTVGEDQLNGSKIIDISNEDWKRIEPFLKENEELFGIKVDDLVNVDGTVRRPEEVYRKVVPVELAALSRYDQGI